MALNKCVIYVKVKKTPRYRRQIVTLVDGFNGWDWGFTWGADYDYEGQTTLKCFLVPGMTRNLPNEFKTKKAAIKYAKKKGWEEVLNPVGR